MNQTFKICINEVCGDTLIARLAEKGITAIKSSLSRCVRTYKSMQSITCVNMPVAEYHKMFTWKFMCAEGIIKGTLSKGQGKW